MPHRAGESREDRADARGRIDVAAPLGALGDGPGILDLYDGVDRTAPRRRSRRARGLSCRAPRQWPQRAVGRCVPGHAALHPLRRLSQPLPGLCRGWWPCLWLGLFGADGRGPDADADRHRRSRPSSQCLDVLRALRKRLSDAHSIAEDDAAVARARIRKASRPQGATLGLGALGVPRPAAGALSRGEQYGQPRARSCWRRTRPVPLPAARLGLDRYARHAGPAGQELHDALGRAPRPSGAAGRRTMSDARGQILGGIRAGLGRGRLGEAERAALDARLDAHPRNLVPARAAALDYAGQIALFVAMAEEVDATVARVASPSEVPAAVADYLSAQNLPARLVVAPDPQLDDIPWSERPLLELRKGMAEPSDAAGLTGCFAAIAETGTLMLVSGPESPTRNNFLPDTHITVLRASQVVAAYED